MLNRYYPPCWACLAVSSSFANSALPQTRHAGLAASGFQVMGHFSNQDKPSEECEVPGLPQVRFQQRRGGFPHHPWRARTTALRSALGPALGNAFENDALEVRDCWGRAVSRLLQSLGFSSKFSHGIVVRVGARFGEVNHRESQGPQKFRRASSRGPAQSKIDSSDAQKGEMHWGSDRAALLPSQRLPSMRLWLLPIPMRGSAVCSVLIETPEGFHNIFRNRRDRNHITMRRWKRGNPA